MLRCSTILVSVPLLLLVACSGAGVSTTARTTTDSAPVDTEASGVTDASADDSNDEDEDDSDPSDAEDEASADDEAGTSAADSDDPSTDSGTPDESESGDTAPEEVTFEGSWLSEGDNLAPLLVDLTGAVSISATFGAQAFTVDTIDDQGQMVQQVGVYTATPSGVGEIYEITLEQTMPQAVTVEGIFEIDDSVSPAILRYEVVQTEPSVGAVAPTAEGGFGSTSFGSDLTQIFVRQ